MHPTQKNSLRYAKPTGEVLRLAFIHHNPVTRSVYRQILQTRVQNMEKAINALAKRIDDLENK